MPTTTRSAPERRRRSVVAPQPKCGGSAGATAAGARGILVVLVGAEGRGKDMLVSIARRRFVGDEGLAFPARLTTRTQAETSGDVVVSRRALRDMAAAGELLCAWQTEGQAFGLGAAARRALEDGRTVVVVAGRDAVAPLRAVWDDVRVIEVMAGPDAIRPALGRGPLGRGEAGAVALRHPGDVAAAVRRFHEIIAAMRPVRPVRPVAGAEAARIPSVAPRRGAVARKGLRGAEPRA